jgi:hypothetical protein
MQKAGFLGMAVAAVVLAAAGASHSQQSSGLGPAADSRDRLVPSSAPAHFAQWKGKPLWRLLAGCTQHFAGEAAQSDFFMNADDEGRESRMATEAREALLVRVTADRRIPRDQAAQYEGVDFNSNFEWFQENRAITERLCRDAVSMSRRLR